MLPEGWKKIQLRCLVASLDGGVSVNGEDRQIGEGEKGVLRVSSVSNGIFRPEEHKAILNGEVEQARVSPKANRIIVSRSNTELLVGASAYVEESHPNLFLSDKLWQIEPYSEKEMSVRWLAYWLGSDTVRTHLSRLGTGTSGSMKNISKDGLLSLWVPVPPPKEQSRIANLLQDWDIAISKTEGLLANSQYQKQGLMRELLTRKRRLPNFHSAWATYRLGDLFDERVEPNREDLPLLSITRDEGVIPRDDVGRKDTSNEDKSKYLRICPGDIGYNTMRMWQGVSALSAYEGIISPAYTVVTPKPLIDGRFAAYLFKFKPVIFLFYRYSQGLVSDTWNLKYPHFSEIKVTIPERAEQEAIARILADTDAEIALLQARISALQAEKRALMQQLLTGKRRIQIHNPMEEVCA